MKKIIIFLSFMFCLFSCSHNTKGMENFLSQKNTVSDMEIYAEDFHNRVNEKQLAFINRIKELEKEIGLKEGCYRPFFYPTEITIHDANERQTQFIARIQELEEALGIEHKELGIYRGKDLFMNRWYLPEGKDIIGIRERLRGRTVEEIRSENEKKGDTEEKKEPPCRFPGIVNAEDDYSDEFNFGLSAHNFASELNKMQKKFVARILELEEELGFEKGDYQFIDYRRGISLRTANKILKQFIARTQELEEALGIEHKELGIPNEEWLFYEKWHIAPGEPDLIGVGERPREDIQE